jgi:hypothetical protein
MFRSRLAIISSHFFYFSSMPPPPKLPTKKEPLKKLPNILARRPTVVKPRVQGPAQPDPLISMRILKSSKTTKFICGKCDTAMATKELAVQHIKGHYQERHAAAAAVQKSPPKQVLAVPAPIRPAESEPRLIQNVPPTAIKSDVIAEGAADKFCLTYYEKSIVNFLPENLAESLIEYCPEDGD